MGLFGHKLPDELIPQGDICVPLSIPAHPDYIKLLVRAIRLLELDRMYERDANHSAKIVRNQWSQRTITPLIQALADATGCVECETGDCIAYPASASIITYSPQNPYSEPDEVPSGYLTPPFTLFKNFPLAGWLSQYFPSFTEQLTGYLPDDVIVDISSIPSGNWNEPALGVPQIAIDVNGNGILELHMINFPLGGRAIVTIDSQPNVGDILGGILGNQEFSIELNRDIISIPPETVPVSIFEVEIDDPTPTAHTIYISFVPTVDDSLIPINFGGGIRKVVSCGFDEVIMSLVEDVRINQATCQLEKLINGQWIADGDVNACVTAITNTMQTQIDTNTNNIANNQTAITANANNISTLQSDVNQIKTVDIPQINLTLTDHENRISVNEGDIVDHDGRIVTLEANIAQNNGILSNHEQRIVALENTSGGGGGGSGGQNVKMSSFTVPVGADYVKVSGGWETVITEQFQFTYTNALIIVELKANNSNAAPITKFRLSVGADIGSHESWTQDTIVNSIQINDDFTGIDTTQPVSINIQWDITGGSGRVFDNQYIQFAVFEFSDIPVATSNTVTFDSGGMAYTLPVAQLGTVDVSGGNPDGCLKSPSYLNDGEYIEVEFTTPSGNQESITDVQFDFLSDNFYTQCIVFVDNVQIGTPIGTQGLNDSLWHSRSWAFDKPSEFPLLGTVVRVRFEKVSGSFYDMRLDNLKVVTA